MCQKVNNKTTNTKEDGFLKLKMVKVPDFAEGVAVAPEICSSLCLHNCSCVAYCHDTEIGWKFI
ncbi:putative non-specific serine/threonine protein kinase [Medicago truncatula]|uniref:Putative non-specific serine/threonine protein kinase n=1 Tax=Medicago truncatula TaxID=3880 RepID=A0A396H2F4_MEDTR|nr:putative non-specific serine/threonine protein kinase [Medicago truncatula]